MFLTIQKTWEYLAEMFENHWIVLAGYEKVDFLKKQPNYLNIINFDHKT